MIIHVDLDQDAIEILDGLCSVFHKERHEIIEDALVYYSNACKPISEMIEVEREGNHSK